MGNELANHTQHRQGTQVDQTQPSQVYQHFTFRKANKMELSSFHAMVTIVIKHTFPYSSRAGAVSNLFIAHKLTINTGKYMYNGFEHKARYIQKG